jgi:uncharacterized protein YcaQ
LLTRPQARRIAIRATGLGAPRPAGRVTAQHLRKVVRQLGVVQLDSVNAVARAHELLFFSRLGPYEPKLLFDLVYRKRELYEGWLHVASLIPTEWWPLLEWRRTEGIHPNWHDFRRTQAAVIDEVRELLREGGPLAAADLEHLGPRGGPWWGWSQGKRVLESMFVFGEVAVTTRRGAFERVYDLAERVIRPDVFAAHSVPEHETRRELLLHAAQACGIGTYKDLADHFRLSITKTRAAMRELVAEGALVEHQVEGWSEPAYALPSLSIPRNGCPDGRLVSPFDPLVWYRPRDVRLFDFDYTIEIYTPEPKRRYGYYVLPFLQGDDIVARVDVRADRNRRVLRVPGAYSEDGESVDLDGLVDELRLLARWQGCDDIEVGEKGDLAKPLRRSVA